MKMFKSLLSSVLMVCVASAAVIPSLAMADCSSRFESRIFYLESREAKRSTILHYNVQELEDKLMQELANLRASEGVMSTVGALMGLITLPLVATPAGLISSGFILGTYSMGVAAYGLAGAEHYYNNKIEKKIREDYQQLTDKIRKAEAATIASIGDELGDRKQTMRALLEAQGLEVEENIELMSEKTGVSVEKIKALFVKGDQSELFCPGGKLLSSLEVGTIVSQMMWDEVYKENKRRK